MKVAIVKYNAGNIYSVVNALKRLGVDPILTDDAHALRTADKVLFPGQGEARQAMTYLREHGLDKVICSLTQPVLGICIGQQLMCRHSEEGDTDCLGIFPVDVKRFQPTRHEEKVPHMGWNRVEASEGVQSQASLWARQKDEGASPYFYFIHSFYVPVCEFTTGVTDYIVPFSAMMQRDNFHATQFHPEKSGTAGELLLRQFLKL